jgi:hypothetical protein
MVAGARLSRDFSGAESMNGRKEKLLLFLIEKFADLDMNVKMGSRYGMVFFESVSVCDASSIEGIESQRGALNQWFRG